jgi:hypothetical protein
MTTVPIRLSASAGRWPARRRFFVARLLRVPTRHLASVSAEGTWFRAACVCGWQGDPHDHPGTAFSQAHVHTRYVDGVVKVPDESFGY